MRYLILILLLLSIPQSTAEPEITLSYLLPTGDMRQQTQALFIKESLKHLGIKVELNYVTPDLYLDYVNGEMFADSVASHDLLMYPISPWSDYFNSFDNERIQSMPDFSWNYDFTENSNPSIYKLGSNRPVFGSLTAAEFIEMIQDINTQESFKNYKEKLSEFMHYFMAELLFDIPIFKETEAVTIHKGFGDELSFEWDPNGSMLDHLMGGFRWMRPNSTQTTIPGVVESFMDVLEYVQDPLIYFDEEFNPHPALAYQYVVGDFEEIIINNDQLTRVFRHTFYIPTDRYWSTGQEVIANDFILGLKYNPFDQRIPEYLSYEIGSTQSINDTLTIFIDVNNLNTWDFYDLGGIRPLPSHIFGDGLHDFFGETSKILQSNEWELFMNNPSLVGPFELLGNSLRIRDDYYFPKESDISNYYGNEFLGMEVLTNLNFSTFAPHTQTSPLYWQDQSILTIKIVDGNLTAFQSGDMDIIYQEVEGFVTKERFTKTFPTLLVFNLANEYLQDFRVRKAIAHAINREELKKTYSSVELSTSMLAGLAHVFEEDLATSYSMNAAKVVLNGGGFFSVDNNPEVSNQGETSLILTIIFLIIPIIRIRKRDLYT